MCSPPLREAEQYADVHHHDVNGKTGQRLLLVTSKSFGRRQFRAAKSASPEKGNFASYYIIDDDNKVQFYVIYWRAYPLPTKIYFTAILQKYFSFLLQVQDFHFRRGIILF